MTTITTAKLREMAHTLGKSVVYTQMVFMDEFDVTIDDTPADTEEPRCGFCNAPLDDAPAVDDLCGGCADLRDYQKQQYADTQEQTMTITHEQLLKYASLAEEDAETVRYLYDLAGITPAEPPAEMVKLARKIADRAIIPMVLEEAAKVADAEAKRMRLAVERDGKLTDSRHGVILAGDTIAAAIRAIGAKP